MRAKRRLVGFAAALAVPMAVLVATPAHAAAPGYVPMSALVNGDTVTATIDDGSGGQISVEQYAAQRAGFTVTVVSGATWEAMSQADFAKYQLLVVGDPICSTVSTTVTSSAANWVPVVMGRTSANTKVGNRTLVGTDPGYHYYYQAGSADPSTVGPEHLVEAGIRYAGAVAGATGIYFDTTCGINSDTIATLNSLSATGTGFTSNDSPPCGGSVAIVADNPAFAGVSREDIEGWGCSVHTTYPTYPADWQVFAVATDTSTKPTCGTDPKTGVAACGEAYVLVAGEGIVVTAPDLSLTPASGSSVAGGSHTVTAAVVQDGSPVVGQLVSFTVTGQNAGVSGTCSPAACTTDDTGKVTFTYADANGVGTDTISASMTQSGSTQKATAAWEWVAGPVNHAPVATAQSVTTPQDTAKPVTLAGTDADGDSLTFSVVAAPSHGTLSGTAPNLVYTPAAGYVGPDSFTFKASDGSLDSAAATVSITVTAVSEGCTATAPSPDGVVSRDIAWSTTHVVSPAVSTSADGDLLVAFVSADGPKTAGQKVTRVSGGGLTWSLRSRSNLPWGTSEVWTARASATLHGARVTATLRYAYHSSITVAAFKGADVGAVGSASALSGAPAVDVKATACGSLVWAVGHDWSRATAVAPVTGQALVHQFRDRSIHDTSWVSKVLDPTAAAGDTVSVKVTGPVHDRWTLAALEIRPAG